MQQKGFGLIEVMLAIVLVAVTAGGLLQLNKTYLEYSRDGQHREVAMRLAESELDKLRAFHGRAGFQAITDGQDSITLEQMDFERRWQVSSYHWNHTTKAWENVPNGNKSMKKRLTVTVSWSENGDPQQLMLTSALSHHTSLVNDRYGRASRNLP